VETHPTLADGLCVSLIGDLAFSIAREHVLKTVEVTEDEIALAILRAVEKEKEVVEGAGAAGLAALLAGRLPELRGKNVVLLFCGGNIDPIVLGRVIDKGLAADGRLARFRTRVADRPGGLADLSRLIADEGANIIEIYHDRTFGGTDVFAVRVVCTVETRGPDHLLRLRAALETAHYPMVL
jgi:threonine dehydratase